MPAPRQIASGTPNSRSTSSAIRCLGSKYSMLPSASCTTLYGSPVTQWVWWRRRLWWGFSGSWCRREGLEWPELRLHWSRGAESLVWSSSWQWLWHQPMPECREETKTVAMLWRRLSVHQRSNVLFIDYLSRCVTIKTLLTLVCSVLLFHESQWLCYIEKVSLHTIP